MRSILLLLLFTLTIQINAQKVCLKGYCIGDKIESPNKDGIQTIETTVEGWLGELFLLSNESGIIFALEFRMHSEMYDTNPMLLEDYEEFYSNIESKFGIHFEEFDGDDHGGTYNLFKDGYEYKLYKQKHSWYSGAYFLLLYIKNEEIQFQTKNEIKKKRSEDF